MWSAIFFRHFLFLNVDFTDSSSKMSRIVKKNNKRFIQIQYEFASCRPYWNRHFLFIYLVILLLFVISIFKNPQLPSIKHIRSKERCMSVLQRDIKTPQIYKCLISLRLACRLGLGTNSVGSYPSDSKNVKKVWNSFRVFLYYIIYYKTLIVFLQ